MGMENNEKKYKVNIVGVGEPLKVGKRLEVWEDGWLEQEQEREKREKEEVVERIMNAGKGTIEPRESVENKGVSHLTSEEIKNADKKYILFGNSGRSFVLDQIDLLSIGGALKLNEGSWDLKTPFRDAVRNRFKKNKTFRIQRFRALLDPKESGYLVQRVS